MASTTRASLPRPRSPRLTSLESLRGVPLHLALVEPEIPPNTGNVARLCAATGCALHLVQPLGFSIEDRDLKRAGLDYWHHVSLIVHPSLAAFLDATASLQRWFFSTRADRVYTEAPFAAGDVLIFGKETKGLPDDLLVRYPENALRIPMRQGSVRSINLSTAVGIATYAALEKVGFPGLD
jgi:tRNA (cytidine/uridine-2'-O-)-methyltransferase